jgi:hypothetical protein
MIFSIEIEKAFLQVSSSLSALCGQLPVEGGADLSAANRRRVKEEIGRLVGRLQVDH